MFFSSFCLSFGMMPEIHVCACASVVRFIGAQVDPSFLREFDKAKSATWCALDVHVGLSFAQNKDKKDMRSLQARSSEQIDLVEETRLKALVSCSLDKLWKGASKRLSLEPTSKHVPVRQSRAGTE